MPAVNLTDADRAALVSRLRGLVPSAAHTVDLLVREAADPRAEILAQADALRADLIVMGSHGRSGLSRVLLGSVTETVIRRAGCPVLAVPARRDGQAAHVPARILCAVDFSDSSREAVRMALDLGERWTATVVLLHAIDLPPELQELELEETPTWDSAAVDNVRTAARTTCLRRMRALLPPGAEETGRVRLALADGKPHAQLLKTAAEEATDLIVMGVQGRGAIDLAIFGSTTHAVLRRAACPVLTLRPRGEIDAGG